jgi:hypothetical protein
MIALPTNLTAGGAANHDALSSTFVVRGAANHDSAADEAHTFAPIYTLGVQGIFSYMDY